MLEVFQNNGYWYIKKVFRNYCQLSLPNGILCSFSCAHTGSTKTSKNLERHLESTHSIFKSENIGKMIKKGIKKEFNELILKMIISGSLLYCFVENVYFKKIIEHYTSMTPLNVLQFKDVESILYLEKIIVINKILSDLTTVSMITDRWTWVPLKKGFISLTIHYLNVMRKHESLELAIYTAINIYSKLCDICEIFDLNMDKISSMPADNASSIKKNILPFFAPSSS